MPTVEIDSVPKSLVQELKIDDRGIRIIGYRSIAIERNGILIGWQLSFFGDHEKLEKLQNALEMVISFNGNREETIFTNDLWHASFREALKLIGKTNRHEIDSIFNFGFPDQYRAAFEVGKQLFHKLNK